VLKKKSDFEGRSRQQMKGMVFEESFGFRVIMRKLFSGCGVVLNAIALERGKGRLDVRCLLQVFYFSDGVVRAYKIEFEISTDVHGLACWGPRS